MSTTSEECSHYTRRCKLVCPQCDNSYSCRLCHNASETHEVDRVAVKEVVCTDCHMRQPKAKKCVGCEVTFGKYSCLICSLFDDDTSKAQFHCEGCGLCRVGGRSNFFHCDTCGCCLPSSIMEEHKCIEDVSNRDCVICLENIHTSRERAHIPPCHHLLHESCFKEMVKKGLYACPTCGKSILDLKESWSRMDEIIRRVLMPAPLRDLFCQITCKDCNFDCITSFHIDGLKCILCGSYNTTRGGGSLLKKEQASNEVQAAAPPFPLVLTAMTNKESIIEELKSFKSVDVDELMRNEPLPSVESGSDSEYMSFPEPEEDDNDDFGEDQLQEDEDMSEGDH